MKFKDILSKIFYRIQYLKNEKLKQFFITVFVLMVLIIILFIVLIVKQNYENKVKKDILSTVLGSNEIQNTKLVSNIDKSDEYISSELGKDSLSSSEAQDIKESIIYYEVYICGEIKNPGVYSVKEGTRVKDIIEMAGGVTENAFAEALNLAEKVFDEQKIYVPSSEEVLEKPSLIYENNENTKDGNSFKIININLATQDEFEKLPGIGPALASRIVEYRNLNGFFSSIEDIKNVKGIGDEKFNDIKDMIKV
jgi:competence protein ComEA